MAKVTGPLFSEKAKGKFANTITYFDRNRQPMATTITPPKKKRSLLQIQQNDKFKEGQEGWKDLSDEEKGEWERDAKDHNDEHPGWDKVSGRCLFMKTWMSD